MVGRLNSTPGISGPAMADLVREMNREVRSIARQRRENEEEAEGSPLEARGETVLEQANVKIQIVCRLAKLIHPFMIRRGHRSIDSKGKALINLPRRFNISIRLVQNHLEEEALNDALSGMTAQYVIITI